MHPAQRRNRSIVLTAGAGISQRGLQVVSTLVLMPVLLKALGTEGFGIWGAASSLAWLAGFTDIGTGTALVTLVSRAIALHDTASARRYLSGAVSLGCLLAATIGMATLAGCSLVAPNGQTGPYYVAVIGLALNIPLNAANNVWMALQEGYFSNFWEFVQTLLTFSGLVAVSVSSADVWVYVAAVYGALVLSNLGSLIHLFWRHPELRPESLLVPFSVMRSVAGQGLLYFILALTGSVLIMLDNVLTLALLGAEASAVMTIALRICIMALTCMGVMTQPLWPAFAEAAEKNDRHWIRLGLLRGSVLLLGAAAAGSAVLLLYGESLLHWWLRTPLGINRSLLWAIAAWVLAQASIRVPCLLLNGLSIIRYQIAVSATAAVVALGLKVLFASQLGVAGVLWGTTVATSLIIFPGVLWRVLHWGRHPGKDPAKQARIIGELAS